MLACSFDAADAAPARRFFVHARDPILRASRLTPAPVIGGSTGRIGIVIRDDGLIAPDADVDAAQALAEALREQGFDSQVVVATAARAEDFDLIHLVGHRHVHQFAYILDEAKRRDVPVVATPMFDDFANESLWGTAAIRTMLSGLRDDATQQMVERGLAERRLLTDGDSERGKPAYDAGLVRAMLQQSRSAIFATRAEEAEVRARFGFTGSSRIVPSVPSRAIEPQPVGALCGLDEYVLVHASVEPRANQWISMRAAAAIGAACVLVGTVENAEYYQSLLEAGGNARGSGGELWRDAGAFVRAPIRGIMGGTDRRRRPGLPRQRRSGDAAGLDASPGRGVPDCRSDRGALRSAKLAAGRARGLCGSGRG
jgi:hypothetical protein